MLYLFGIDLTHLTCHPSGEFAGLLDIRGMLGELVVLASGVNSLGLLRCACQFI
jgi:hypothetical protein